MAYLDIMVDRLACRHPELRQLPWSEASAAIISRMAADQARADRLRRTAWAKKTMEANAAALWAAEFCKRSCNQLCSE